MSPTQSCRVGEVCLILAFCLSGAVRAQGPLAPPGAPAPTMKSLAQVEPRTIITAIPYTITQPGSYYLATNLSSTGHGLIIRADYVTVDMMGFSLSGDRGSGDYGVWIDGAAGVPHRNVVVRDGTLKSFDIGVFCDYTQQARLTCLSVSSNLMPGRGADLSRGSQGERLQACRRGHRLHLKRQTPAAQSSCVSGL